MTKHYTLLLIFLASFFHADAQALEVVSQMVNPCGDDGRNEWVLFRVNSQIAIDDIGFSSAADTGGVTLNYNYHWGGANVPTPNTTEPCGGTSLRCYDLVYDTNSNAQARRDTLNAIAGCDLFTLAPDTLPAGSEVFVFLGGAHNNGFDEPRMNLDFSGLCGISTYYALMGTGSLSSGYFSNSSDRVMVVLPGEVSYPYNPFNTSPFAGYYNGDDPSTFLAGTSCGIFAINENTDIPVEEALEPLELSAYGSQGSVYMTIQAEKEKPVRISLFDLRGQMVYDQRHNVREGENRIRIDNLPQSILGYKVYTLNDYYTGKLSTF